MHAARKGMVESVKILLESGLDVNARDAQNWTALRLAADWGSTENTIGSGAREITSDHLETVALLLEAGAEVDAQNSEGMTALLYARQRGREDIVQLLKAAGPRS